MARRLQGGGRGTDLGVSNGMRNNKWTADLAAGGVAGLIATGPMTFAMKLLHRELPWLQRYPLPPRQITVEATRKAGVEDQLNHSQRRGLTYLSHFSYGTSVGALYGPVSRQLPGPPAIKGMGYGLLVWTVSYLGLLPALRLLSPATKHPARRNALMIAVHLVWGAVLGVVTDYLQSGTRRTIR